MAPRWIWPARPSPAPASLEPDAPTWLGGWSSAPAAGSPPYLRPGADGKTRCLLCPGQPEVGRRHFKAEQHARLLKKWREYADGLQRYAASARVHLDAATKAQAPSRQVADAWRGELGAVLGQKDPLFPLFWHAVVSPAWPGDLAALCDAFAQMCPVVIISSVFLHFCWNFGPRTFVLTGVWETWG